MPDSASSTGADEGETPTDSESSRGEVTPSDSDASRSLVVGSLRRVLAESDSWLLKSYAVVSALFAGLLLVFLLLAFPVWVVGSAGGSELSTFSRAFLLVGGLFVLAPLLAPVLSASRRHAQSSGPASAAGDALLGLAGYLFVLSLYIALLVSAPADQRDPPPDAIGPVVEALYRLDPVWAVAPPVVAAGLIFAVHRWTR